MNFTILCRNADTDETLDHKSYSSMRFAMRNALRFADVNTEVLVFELGIHVLTVNPDKTTSVGTEKSWADVTRQYNPSWR